MCTLQQQVQLGSHTKSAMVKTSNVVKISADVDHSNFTAAPGC